MISVWAFTALPLFMGAVPFLFFESLEPLAHLIAWECLSLALFCFSLFHALSSCQRAELDEAGITLRSPFGVIRTLTWDELADVRTESINTFSSRGVPVGRLDHIVLYTESSQRYGEKTPANRRKKGPWFVAGTPENIETLAKYLIAYAPHVTVDPDLLF